MYTTYDKAIAAVLAPILGALILSCLPESMQTISILISFEAIFTGLIVYFVPNKPIQASNA
jgi:ABC-type xylose transport system permease subunit